MLPPLSSKLGEITRAADSLLPQLTLGSDRNRGMARITQKVFAGVYVSSGAAKHQFALALCFNATALIHFQKAVPRSVVLLQVKTVMVV